MSRITETFLVTLASDEKLVDPTDLIAKTLHSALSVSEVTAARVSALSDVPYIVDSFAGITSPSDIG